MPSFHLCNNNVCTRLYLFGQDLKSLLLQNCWQELPLNQADLIFVNSCSFLTKTENFFLAKIEKLDKSKTANQKIIVFGCLPHTSLEKLRMVFSGEIMPARDLAQAADLLGLKSINSNIGYSIPRQLRTLDRFNYFINKYLIRNAYLGYLSGEPAYYLNIARGCLGKCTYCSEKTARGPLSSWPIADIAASFRTGLKQGYRIFSLNADDVGVFGWDRKENIAGLLNELLSADGDFKIILTEFNPWGLIKHQQELLSLLASKKIAHITIPLQSGSDKILKLMRRPYSILTVMDIIRLIRNNNPNIIINTHLIAGFPGETEEDFRLTLDLVKSGLFDKVKVFPYSDRPQVPSYDLPYKIPPRIMAERSRRLRYETFRQALLKLNLRNILLNLQKI
ncbi:MAG: radical SAM protein [Patescibacteria group bacterium]|jgi:MiaB/RimO family radical SAM methylthiotransferase